MCFYCFFFLFEEQKNVLENENSCQIRPKCLYPLRVTKDVKSLIEQYYVSRINILIKILEYNLFDILQKIIFYVKNKNKTDFLN